MITKSKERRENARIPAKWVWLDASMNHHVDEYAFDTQQVRTVMTNKTKWIVTYV